MRMLRNTKKIEFFAVGSWSPHKRWHGWARQLNAAIRKMPAVSGCVLIESKIGYLSYRQMLEATPCCACGAKKRIGAYRLKISVNQYNSRWSVPLCNDCRNQTAGFSATGELSWFRTRGVDALALSARLWARWSSPESSKVSHSRQANGDTAA